ncbi:MAG: phosphoribosylglycinamide formyltransferase [Pseudomonadota bacterium]
MTQPRVSILISGGGSNMVSLINAMQSGDVPGTPALVFSNRADAPGLSKAAILGVSTRAIDHRPYATRETFEADITTALEEHRTDIICLAGFMRILTPGFVSRWAGQILNIHPSLLPKYPGLNTHARAIEAGDKEAGCTVHQATEVLDDGPILGQRRVPIMTDDTPQILATRVLKEEHKLYPEALARFIKGT